MKFLTEIGNVQITGNVFQVKKLSKITFDIDANRVLKRKVFEEIVLKMMSQDEVYGNVEKPIRYRCEILFKKHEFHKQRCCKQRFTLCMITLFYRWYQ